MVYSLQLLLEYVLHGGNILEGDGVHCHGQFRYGDQRNGRRCDRGDRKRHRQPNDSPGKTINLLLIFSHSKKIFNFASIVHKRTTAVK